MEHPTLQQLFTAFAPTSLAYRSDAVTPGAVFFCIKGAKSDGHDFAPDAAARGAIALVVEHPVPVDLPQTVVSNARTALALASVRFFGDPSAHLAVTAVTGTNGKTTTTYLVDWIIRHALQAQGQPAGTTGLIGTVETRIKASRLPSKYTTPESYDLQELLRHMADEGVTHVTMEASSHALALDRVAGMHVCVAAFSNLTQDHLDFHGTMEAYFEAKAKLFDSPLVAARVVNIDDAYGRTLAQRCESNGHAAYTVGFSPGAQLQATAVTYTSEGSQLTVRTEQGAFTFAYPLIGAFNAHNVLLAAGCAHLLGIDYPTITAALAQAPQVPGRLERVKLEGQQGGQVAQGAGAVLARLRDPKAARTHSAQQSSLRSVQIAHPSDPSQPSRSESPEPHLPPAPPAPPADDPIKVFVDYSHTPDSIEKALDALDPLKTHEVIIVFGCGGDRDATKRPLMGAAACKADYAVVTSDNPRTEDPLAIIGDILPGMAGHEGRFEVEPNRRRAIARALEHARPGDLVLIAGKGHEDYQLVGDQVLDFDDRLVAAEEMGKLCS